MEIKTCNICGCVLRQHEKKKKYFFCKNCEKWYKCWLPLSPNKMRIAIDKINKLESLK